MHVQIVQDHTGDTRHEFDPANATAVKEAMERFDKLVKEQKRAAFVKTGEGTRDNVKVFDPTHEDVLFIPHRQGG